MDSSFPSLIIKASALLPKGSFAEAQATYLRPDSRAVTDLDALLEKRNAGIVAHFYMDVELQGVLTALSWPHVHIADSLKMADAAVTMAKGGVDRIAVLGVDFMSENVRAVLDAAGFGHVEVYRLSSEDIGCTLAESAEAPAYTSWLQHAGNTRRALHVVYINTSLLTKARAHSIVPTITCTSSNVVQTILQADHQIDDLEIFYGPDTYMGANLQSMFAQFSQLSDEAIRGLHPAHDRASLTSLLGRFRYYEQGACLVHHMFGDDVVRRVQEEHADALLTAHLEVPGEMFALAADAQADGRGVVGSTSNILGFITGQVDAAMAASGPQRLAVVLGTEAGMITSIVSKVQRTLQQHARDDVEVEIIFPVASEAVAAAPDSMLQIVPGVAAGEGCSVAGGCATCPFMKMNDLQALFDVLETSGDPASLTGYAPRSYTETIAGRTAADLGSEPILHMRHLQQTGELPQALVRDVETRPGC
ncbi:MAG: quinolinate synthase NadA [Myxococcales bacterium]|nr:quinolinate synthase NadA [Myxococcales bacterium]